MTDREMQERQEFLADRQRGLGGTDMAKILGVDDDSGEDALDVYFEKTRPMSNVPEQDNVDMLRGRVTEPVAADLYWGFTGRKGRKAPAVYTHPDFPAFRCHLDYDIFADDARLEGMKGTGVLEIKNPRSQRFRRLVEQGPKAKEVVQVQTYIAVTRRAWGSLGYCNLEDDSGPILSMDFVVDPEMDAFLLSVGQRFYDEHVVPRIPPDPQVWKLLWKEQGPPMMTETTGELVTIEDPDALEMGVLVLDATRLKKHAEEQETHAKQAMKQWIEANAGSDRTEAPGIGKFTIVRQAGRRSFRQDTLAAAMPLDRDKVQAWVQRVLVHSDVQAGPAAIASVEAALGDMALDLTMFYKEGAPFSFLKATDNRK